MLLGVCRRHKLLEYEPRDFNAHKSKDIWLKDAPFRWNCMRHGMRHLRREFQVSSRNEVCRPVVISKIPHGPCGRCVTIETRMAGGRRTGDRPDGNYENLPLFPRPRDCFRFCTCANEATVLFWAPNDCVQCSIAPKCLKHVQSSCGREGEGVKLRLLKPGRRIIQATVYSPFRCRDFLGPLSSASLSRLHPFPSWGIANSWLLGTRMWTKDAWRTVHWEWRPLIVYFQILANRTGTGFVTARAKSLAHSGTNTFHLCNKLWRLRKTASEKRPCTEWKRMRGCNQLIRLLAILKAALKLRKASSSNRPQLKKACACRMEFTSGAHVALARA